MNKILEKKNSFLYVIQINQSFDSAREAFEYLPLFGFAPFFNLGTKLSGCLYFTP
jgi:hypothetical protein